MANFLKSLFVKGIEIDPAGASTNQVLKYNGTKFAPAADATGSGSLDDLTDVVITTPEEFQGLSYNGTNWVNGYIPLVTYVRNAEATTLTTGTCVYLFGATGDHATVKRADNDADATSSKTIGVVGANIATSQNGPVVTRGYVDGINLSVGYTAGDILWLGEDGGFTTTKPSAPEHLVFIGVVVRATNNGIIYVATQNGYELDELHDVSILSPSAGQLLAYDSSGLWKNTNTVGSLTIDTAGTLVFEGATADGFETTVTVTDPTADRTITLPNATGTVALTADKLSAFASTSSSELAGVISDETGSGALVFGTSPAITTSLTTPSTTFSLLNTTATTINFGGDATTLNIGSSAGTTAIAGYLTSRTLNVSQSQVNILNNNTYSPNDGLFFFTTDTNSIYTQLKASTATSSKVITLPNTTGTVALTANKLNDFAATSSSELAGVISDETGSGSLVFATSPSLTTPTLGVASATSINKVAITAPATSATLTIANGKTLTASNTLTFTGTDSSSVAFGAGGTVAYTANNLGVFAESTSATIGVGSINLGHASDTTISRQSAGIVQIESNAVATFSTSQGGTFYAGTFDCASTGFYRTTAFPTTAVATTLRVGNAFGFDFVAKPTSLRKYKENIVDIPNALTTISTLKPRQFTWKAQPTDTLEFAELRQLDPAFGFIVEEIAETNRELLCWDQPEDQRGVGLQTIDDLEQWTPSYWRESDMIALCVKAIQELTAKVEALEARLG